MSHPPSILPRILSSDLQFSTALPIKLTFDKPSMQEYVLLSSPLPFRVASSLPFPHPLLLSQTPTGISRLTAAEIKSLLGQAGLKKSGDKGMITDRCTGFFNAAGLSLEGTLDDLRDRIDGYAALGAKGMLPTPGEGSSTGAMQVSFFRTRRRSLDATFELGRDSSSTRLTFFRLFIFSLKLSLILINLTSRWRSEVRLQ